MKNTSIFKKKEIQEVEEYFNRFNNIFHGIIAGPLLVFVFLFLQLDSGKMTPPFEGIDFTTFSIAAFVLNLVYIGWVFAVFRKDRKALKDKYDLKQRLDAYKSISVKFYVLMTLSGVFSILAVLVTGELTFSFIYMLQLFLLSVYRPSVHNICKYLGLKGDEREIVLKKKKLES